MPVNKNKLLRIQTIVTMMRQNLYPNFTSFLREMRRLDSAGQFCLSRKTFLRDIRDLQEEFGAPIRYDSSRKGYYLANREWYSEELLVEPFEMKAAILGSRVASMVLPDPLCGDIAKAVSSLLMRNETGLDEKMEIEGFQIQNRDFLPKVRSDVFLTVYQAWEGRRYLRLDYSPSVFPRCVKLFEPHVLAQNSGCWYVKGLVHSDDGVRHDPPLVQVLALHRINSVELVEGPTFFPSQELLRESAKKGLFDFPKYPEVIITFSKPYAHYVEEFYFGDEGEILSRTEDSVTVRLHDIDRFRVFRLFFGALGYARIESPACLREMACDIARLVLANNRGEQSPSEP